MKKNISGFSGFLDVSCFLSPPLSNFFLFKIKEEYRRRAKEKEGDTESREILNTNKTKSRACRGGERFPEVWFGNLVF